MAIGSHVASYVILPIAFNQVGYLLAVVVILPPSRTAIVDQKKESGPDPPNQPA